MRNRRYWCNVKWCEFQDALCYDKNRI